MIENESRLGSVIVTMKPSPFDYVSNFFAYPNT